MTVASTSSCPPWQPTASRSPPGREKPTHVPSATCTCTHQRSPAPTTVVQYKHVGHATHATCSTCNTCNMLVLHGQPLHLAVHPPDKSTIESIASSDGMRAVPCRSTPHRCVKRAWPGPWPGTAARPLLIGGYGTLYSAKLRGLFWYAEYSVPAYRCSGTFWYGLLWFAIFRARGPARGTAQPAPIGAGMRAEAWRQPPQLLCCAVAWAGRLPPGGRDGHGGQGWGYAWVGQRERVGVGAG